MIDFIGLRSEEIENYTKETFNASSAKVSYRDVGFNIITVECVTEGWDDGESTFSVKDEIEYYCLT